MNTLAEHNARLTKALNEYRQNLLSRQSEQNGRRAESPSPLAALKVDLARVLRDEFGGPEGEPEVQFIDRQKFGGDLVLKFPRLLAKGGPKAFNEQYRDRIIGVVKREFGESVLKDVIAKGMYINLTLADAWLTTAAAFVGQAGEAFGLSRELASDTIVIDYSSPNVAKTLHAGHIRSTIIGHVLGNVYEAAGAAVYRVNHINDFGGFGFLLEGYRRFAGKFPTDLAEHQKLTEIYRIRRTLEKPVDQWDEGERTFMNRYQPIDLAEFTAAADRRFAALERGDAEEVNLWAQMVQWSMADFGSFYRSLGIVIPLVIGESYYFQPADALINQLLKDGQAVIYTDELAARDVAALPESLTEAERQKATEGIAKDVGATVIPLAQGRRLVVRRKDGLSIYATRDVGAVKIRNDLFHPTRSIYVTGQEQKEHFARVFEATNLTGLNEGGRCELLHLYFGFYVDSKTGKKLSSRASAAGVMDLLKGSFDYFKNKLGADVPAEDLNETAQQLSVGSIVFNELKQDIRGSVDIDPSAIQATVEGFEKSGGAYVVYATCRARGILRKLAAQNVPTGPARADALTAEEAGLILKLLDVPDRVVQAARQANPTVLVRHLHDIAQTYNAYYTKARVIEDGQAHPFRLSVTRAVMTALKQGLSVCHIECPERI